MEREPADSRGPWRRLALWMAAILFTVSGMHTTSPALERGDHRSARSARVLVGQEAPDFALQAPDGTTHRLTELRGKKNVVLVFFRGVW